jgi:hypothetical protein
MFKTPPDMSDELVLSGLKVRYLGHSYSSLSYECPLLTNRAVIRRMYLL